MKFLLSPAITMAAILSITTAHAADAKFPTRPVRVIVASSAGTGADIFARIVAQGLTDIYKEQVVVENRVGAGGALGMGMAARAPADGYTLLMSLSSISILPEADRILERKPAFTLNQFKPIARFTADPTVFVVRAEAPWKTLAEFVADAKRKPGTCSFATR